MGKKNRNPSKRQHKENKGPSKKSGNAWNKFFENLGRIILLIETIGYLVALYRFLEAGYQNIFWLGIIILFIIGLIVVLWWYIKKKSRYRNQLIATMVILGFVIWGAWSLYIHSREEKLIVLIAKFEGPEEVFGLRNEIIEELTADFSNSSDVEIETTNEIIKLESEGGSIRARELGENIQADVVIWGWYIQNDNPNINLHIENLSPQLSEVLEESSVVKPSTTLADLKSLFIQQKIGTDTSALINFLAGLIQYQSENYFEAVNLFDKSIDKLGDVGITGIADPSPVYLFRGNSYYLIYEFNQAISDYSKATELDPQYVAAFRNRGVLYDEIGQYDLALLDFTKAIQLDSDNPDAYFLRGIVFSELNQPNEAITDFTTTIQLDSQYALAYLNRGLRLQELSQDSQAITDYTSTININPKLAFAYNQRGLVYISLEKYDLAIMDLRKATQLEPQREEGHNNLAIAYDGKKQYDKAIAEYTKAIQLNSIYFDAYHNRRLTYKVIGRFAEAEADKSKYEDLLSVNISPASETYKLSQYSCEGPLYASTRLYVGSNLYYWYGDQESYKMVADGHELVNIKYSPLGLYIDATVYSDENQLVGKIENNRFTSNPDRYFRLTSIDKHELRVEGKNKSLLFHVRYLNEKEISIQGFFRLPLNRFVIINDEYLQVGTRVVSGACVADASIVDPGLEFIANFRDPSFIMYGEE